jgi:hypothetical protein
MSDILTGPDRGPPKFDWREKAVKLERENVALRGLLLECKQAFLGYPQETRRTPLDLLRDINAALGRK